MDLTPEELRALHDVAVRAIDQAYEVLAGAARRSAMDRRERERTPAPAPELAERHGAPKLAYTVKEASAALGISKTTLYRIRMMSEGELATLRVAGRRLIEAAAIERVLAA
jgi:excisionase family DNA binding protein